MSMLVMSSLMTNLPLSPIAGIFVAGELLKDLANWHCLDRLAILFLMMLERAGKIEDLREQVRYEILPKQDGERAVHYIADFAYTDVKTEQEIVEDVKGVRTKEYILKRKLMLYTCGIKIKEVS